MLKPAGEENPHMESKCFHRLRVHFKGQRSLSSEPAWRGPPSPSDPARTVSSRTRRRHTHADAITSAGSAGDRTEPNREGSLRTLHHWPVPFKAPTSRKTKGLQSCFGLKDTEGTRPPDAAHDPGLQPAPVLPRPCLPGSASLTSLLDPPC